MIGFIFVVVLASVSILFLPSCFSQSSVTHLEPILDKNQGEQEKDAPDRELTYAKFSTNQQIQTPGLKSAILVNYDTGQVIYGFNEHKLLHPASVTKLMTLYITLEKIHQGQLHWNDSVSVSERVAAINESQVYLKAGEVLSLREMVKAMMVASANDAATAIAERVAGTEAGFVKLMNEKAIELGLKDSHFINVSGLPAHNINDQYHHMSAYDIALLSKLLLDQYPEVLEFSGLKSTTIRNGTYAISSTNKLLGSFQGVDGLKTGFTNQAGLCLAATAKRDGLRLISVVLGAPSREIRTASTIKLLNYGFNNYQKVAKVAINGKEVAAAEPSLYVNGSVLVPLESISQAIGANMAIEDQNVVVSRGDTQVVFQMDSRDASWNNRLIQLPQPVEYVKGKIFVPIRILSEAFGINIQWEEKKKAIYIFI